MTGIRRFECVMGAVLAGLLFATGVRAQGTEDQERKSLRDAAFEVIFAQDDAAIEKHLPNATQQALQQMGEERRNGILKWLAFGREAKQHGTIVQRMEGDTPVLRSENPEGPDIFEFNLIKEEIHNGEATVEIAVRRTFAGKAPPEEWSWPTRIVVQARLEDGVWRLVMLQVPPEQPTVLDDAQLLSRLVQDGRKDQQVEIAGSLRLINRAELVYASVYPAVGFTCLLRDLGPSAEGTKSDPHGAGLLDDGTASGKLHGYVFTVQGCTGQPADKYAITAISAEASKSPQRAFCTNQSGVILYSDDGKAETCLAHGQPVQ